MVKEDFLDHALTFKGRFNVEQFWTTLIATYSIILVFYSVLKSMNGFLGVIIILPLVAIVFLLGLFITIATIVKRYHDLGKSGKWACLLYVPYLGIFWILIECGFFRGQPKPNMYGPVNTRSILFN